MTPHPQPVLDVFNAFTKLVPQFFDKVEIDWRSTDYVISVHRYGKHIRLYVSPTLAAEDVVRYTDWSVNQALRELEELKDEAYQVYGSY